jgi:hypothetical protein
MDFMSDALAAPLYPASTGAFYASAQKELACRALARGREPALFDVSCENEVGAHHVGKSRF